MKAIYNKTKIVATLGPASSTEEVISKLIKNGVDVCRINFSHGTHEQHKKTIEIVRAINKKHNLHVGLLGDLQGPKIRIGMVEGEKVTLKKGDTITLTSKEQLSTSSVLYVNYPKLAKEVASGENILLDDGKLKLKVLDTNRTAGTVSATVINGGVLSSKKGVNLPDSNISVPSLTEKDIIDLEFALEHELEWIALSFVRKAEDLIKLRGLIEAKKKSARIIAKIEKPEAVANIDSIIEVSDAIMVARGDLGVELPMEKVPLIQKSLVNKARKAYKPVIIATQMMESMIESAQPTRAEANDVANSVLDGADAVMLSAETSVGKHVVAVVEAMQRIINNVESEGYRYGRVHKPSTNSKTYLPDSLCYSACVLAEEINATAIIGMTRSGYTAFTVSSHRPMADIFIFTNYIPLLNTLSLVWGVRGFYYNKYESTDATIFDVKNILREKGMVKNKQVIINLASMPIHEKSRTNMIKVSVVD